MARPFTISVPDADLEDLQRRLEGARPFPEQLTDIKPWEDGTDLSYFKAFVDYWKCGYDWRAWEAKLNAMGPHFKAEVNGIDLHFIHAPSEQPDALPLLLLHGWPGSFFEFYKLLPLLRASGKFHIVVPSLPGYGFSSPPGARGFGAVKMASTFDALMAQLGYRKYMVQGGDWGAIIARALSKFHAGSCAALHVNMCVAPPPFTSPWALAQIANAALLPSVPLLLSAAEIKGVRDLWAFQQRETGYQAIQGTKPQTLGFALNDSPVGLAAWILEKFQSWTDNKGNPEDGGVTKDEMISNISIYWFTGRITSSMRLYKEALYNRRELLRVFGGYCKVPCGVAAFPREIHRAPRSWIRGYYNLQQYTEMPAGGHFAALEQPELLAKDVIKFADLARAKGWL